MQNTSRAVAPKNSKALASTAGAFSFVSCWPKAGTCRPGSPWRLFYSRIVLGMPKPSKPPKVAFRKHEPLQDYFCDGNGGWYSVAKLLDDTKHLPVFDVPLAALDLSHQIWGGSDMLSLACHVKRCMKADLDAPILLDWEGAIADGRHRVLKALAQGKRTIKARRMTWKPDPCRKDPPA